MRSTQLLCALLIIALNAGVSRAMAQDAKPLVGSKENPAYQNEVLGVSLRALPPETRVVEDQYLSDAFGFTLVPFFLPATSAGVSLRSFSAYDWTFSMADGSSTFFALSSTYFIGVVSLVNHSLPVRSSLTT